MLFRSSTRLISLTMSLGDLELVLFMPNVNRSERGCGCVRQRGQLSCCASVARAREEKRGEEKGAEVVAERRQSKQQGGKRRAGEENNGKKKNRKGYILPRAHRSF